MLLLFGFSGTVRAQPVPAPEPPVLETPVPFPSTDQDDTGAGPRTDLPRPRPEPPAASEEPETDTEPAQSPVSPPATPRLYRTACPALIDGVLTGVQTGPIRDGICVLRSPVEITAINLPGRTIALSGPATLGCPMATRLAEWLENVDNYAAALDSRIVTLRMGTSFACRSRNNVPGADVSEHGFGNALDITGFILESGAAPALPEDWRGIDPKARLMRHAHAAGCALFTTALGPDANRSHRDHIHLDLGCHGESCTARLCE